MSISQHTQEQFSLLDQVPLGICVLQSDHTVLFWNSCLESWTRIARQEILGVSIDQFFPHFAQPLYANRLQQIFAGGSPTVFSSQLHKHLIPAPIANGLRVQQSTVSAIPAAVEGEFLALLSIQDVTDLTFRVQDYRKTRDQAIADAEARRQAQERAEAANRIKDEFLAIVSHELRTPLNPILGWAKLLCSGRVSPASFGNALQTIERNAQLQAQLIDDLLDISRILRGKLHLDLQKIDLSYVVHSALETIRLAADAKSLSIQLHIEEPILPVKGDATRLQQIVWNLLSNAVKFTPANGRIEIYLELINAHLQLRISDTGQGIPTDFLPYVFDSFRQADSTTTRAIGGLGLGLAITRHLVELHGGTIRVESQGEGQGATFTVQLPALKEASTDQALEPTLSLDPSALTLEGVSILVVDDDADTREFLGFLLREYGARVTIAGSAPEAIALFDAANPNLLLSDLGMPEVDGYMLLQQIRSLPTGSDLPAIALTAYAAETTQRQVLAAGFQKHIAKPAEPIVLVSAIAQLVRPKIFSESVAF
jgi:signal transduction histidine kinase/CheY-like chemotaxis protein